MLLRYVAVGFRPRRRLEVPAGALLFLHLRYRCIASRSGDRVRLLGRILPLVTLQLVPLPWNHR